MRQKKYLLLVALLCSEVPAGMIHANCPRTGGLCVRYPGDCERCKVVRQS